MLKWLKNLFSRTPDTSAPVSKNTGKPNAPGKSNAPAAGKTQATDKASKPSGKSRAAGKSKGSGKTNAAGKPAAAEKPVQAAKPAPAREAREEASNPDEFIWCLVGNIASESQAEQVEEVETEAEEEMESETETEATPNNSKHFSPHTKVYCFPPKWNEGNQRCKVIGRHRKSKRHICVVMSADQITNWRMEKVHKPYVVKMMQRQKGWTQNPEDKEKIEEILSKLPNQKAEN